MTSKKKSYKLNILSSGKFDGQGHSVNYLKELEGASLIVDMCFLSSCRTQISAFLSYQMI